MAATRDYTKNVGTGKLIPRLSTSVIEALTGMVGGEMVYDVDTKEVKQYDNNAGRWDAVPKKSYAEENRTALVDHDDTTVTLPELFPTCVITEVIAFITEQNNGTALDAWIQIACGATTLVGSGEIDPYSAPGTRYSFPIFHPIISSSEIPTITFSPDSIPDPYATQEGQIAVLYKVSNFLLT